MDSHHHTPEKKRSLRWLIFSAGIITLIAAFSWLRDSAGALGVAPLVTTNNQYQIAVTNRSDRDVVCWVSALQFKRDEVWENHLINHIIYFGKSPSVPGGLMAPGSAKILTGQEPKYIDVPYETTHWRVTVTWCYADQTLIERGKERVEAWLQGRPVNLQPVLHTNYTSEVVFTAGPKGPPRKPLLP